MRKVEKYHLKALIATIVIIVLIMLVWFGSILRERNYLKSLESNSQPTELPQSQEKVQPQTTSPQQNNIKTFNVDPVLSKITWTGFDNLSQSITGTVLIKAGQLAVDIGSAKFINGVIDIDMTTIDNQNQTADQQLIIESQLKGTDFFDAATYPVASLEITNVSALETDPLNNANISANLTIKDHTLPIQFPALINSTTNQLNAQAVIKIDRTLWGITYGSSRFPDQIVDKIINDEIELHVTLIANITDQ